ncbi:MAG: ParB/RepB/Spo0J family partition protein [Pseudomonadota bacterium]
MRIPLDQIDLHHIPRDRSAIDRDGLDELRESILADGLRTPVEVIATNTGYGLLSGYRRLTVLRELNDLGLPGFDTIEAMVRTPETRLDALRQMVEENEIRRDVSMWDRARIAVECVGRDTDTIDSAVAALYPNVTKQRRHRIRAVCNVVVWSDGALIDPHTHTTRKLERLAAAIAGGHGDHLHFALTSTRTANTAAAQWEVLKPILTEIDLTNAGKLPRDPRPNRPRRFSKKSPRLQIRRIHHPDGWMLKFTGPDASGLLMEDIMDEVERLVNPI